MADNAKTLRDIKIKTGVVKRLHKEHMYYEKELKKEQEKLQKMKDEGKDEYDVRKQQEVADESSMMIPDTKRKFINAHRELEALLEGASEHSEAAEHIDAKKILEETSQLRG